MGVGVNMCLPSTSENMSIVYKNPSMHDKHIMSSNKGKTNSADSDEIECYKFTSKSKTIQK